MRASETSSGQASRGEDTVQCIRLPQKGFASHRGWTTAVYEVQNCLKPNACDRARDAVSEAFDAGERLERFLFVVGVLIMIFLIGRTTDRGVSLPTQDVMVSSLPQRCQEEIKDALEIAASRVSDELPGVTLEFVMSRAFVIVYDAKRQRGLKKHTDGRKEGATLLLLITKPQRDFVGGGTRFFPGILESSFDAKPNLGSCIVFPSDTLQHEGLPIKRGRRLLVCVFATKKQTTPNNSNNTNGADSTKKSPEKHNNDSDLNKPNDALPPDATLRGKGCDDQALAQECACTIS